MGFDLSGIKPTSEEGHDFRANVWYWRPIWKFIQQQLPDLLTPSQIRGGEYNDGTEVIADQAKKDPKDFEASYGMDTELMIEFASFCKNSGGFKIW